MKLMTLLSVIGAMTWSVSSYADETDNIRFDKGYEAVMDGNPKKAFEIWLPLAKKGHLDAMDKIGEMYLSGSGVAKNKQTGLQWLEKAANGGNRFTQMMLGERYAQGIELEKDLNKAIYWYEKAAESRHENAQEAYFELGKIYLLQENYPKAAEYLAKVAEERIGESGYLLGQLYEQGKGVTKDAAKAFELYLGAETPEAYLRLGEMSVEGIGTAKDITKAKVYFQEVIDYTEPYIRDNDDFKLLHRQASDGLAKLK